MDLSVKMIFLGVIQKHYRINLNEEWLTFGHLKGIGTELLNEDRNDSVLGSLTTQQRLRARFDAARFDAVLCCAGFAGFMPLSKNFRKELKFQG